MRPTLWRDMLLDILFGIFLLRPAVETAAAGAATVGDQAEDFQKRIAKGAGIGFPDIAGAAFGATQTAVENRTEHVQ